MRKVVIFLVLAVGYFTCSALEPPKPQLSAEESMRQIMTQKHKELLRDFAWGCRWAVERRLRDPDSYDDDWANLPSRVVEGPNGKLTLQWRFRARNGFGGMNISEAICTQEPGRQATITINQLL